MIHQQLELTPEEMGRALQRQADAIELMNNRIAQLTMENVSLAVMNQELQRDLESLRSAEPTDIEQ